MMQKKILQVPSVSTDINDLEMGYKLCGIRFQGVDVPKGATITRAYIQFTADYATTDASNLQIWGENNSNPSTYSAGGGDLLSARRGPAECQGDCPNFDRSFDSS